MATSDARSDGASAGIGASDDSGDVDRRFKPALQALLNDQRALLDASQADGFEYDLRSGFPDRRTLIEWYQRATVRTLGHLSADTGASWEPTALATDDTLLAALVPDAVAQADRLESERAHTYTRLLEGEALQPACNAAYRDLRGGAGEYIDLDPDDEGLGPEDLDPDEQRYIGMRPGFQVLDDQQQAALAALWGGFERETRLRDWLHDLNAPTNGEVREGLASDVFVDDTAMRYLVDDPEAPKARAWRESFAIVELLPAFAAGVRSVSAGELAARKSTGQQTLQMSGGVSDQ